MVSSFHGWMNEWYQVQIKSWGLSLILIKGCHLIYGRRVILLKELCPLSVGLGRERPFLISQFPSQRTPPRWMRSFGIAHSRSLRDFSSTSSPQEGLQIWALVDDVGMVTFWTQKVGKCPNCVPIVSKTCPKWVQTCNMSKLCPKGVHVKSKKCPHWSIVSKMYPNQSHTFGHFSGHGKLPSKCPKGVQKVSKLYPNV